MSTPEFTAPAPAGARTVEYATFARRLGAALLDSLVWIIGLAFFPVPIGNGTAAAIFGLVILSAWFNYFAICEWRWGQTIGKNMTGVRVLALEGGKLSWQAAVLRNLLRLVDLPLALIGAEYLVVKRSPRRQRLGDRVAKTIVVRDRPQGSVSEGARVDDARERMPAPPYGTATASEIFGDAAQALARHPAAGSVRPATTPPPAEGMPAVPQPQEPLAAPRATWGPALALGGFVVALVATLILSIPVVAVEPDAGTEDASAAANILVQFIQDLALILVPLAIALQGGRRLGGALGNLGVRSFRPSAIGWMALAVVAYLIIASAFYALLHPEQEDIAVEFGGVFFQIVLIVFGAAISEEVCFRGFLYGGLRTRLPVVLATLVSGAIFGLLHAPTGLEAVPQLAALGMILSLLYEKTGSIVPGMILHAINNALALLVS